MAPQAPAKPGGQAPVRPRSFLVGTQQVTEGLDYDQTQTIDSSSHALPNWALTATGWLSAIWLEVEHTVTGQATNAVTYAENGPFNVFSNIELDDINNEAIFGPFDGYTAMLTNKFGGYQFCEDPGTSQIYNQQTGTGTTSGTFRFALMIPVEIVHRDPLGSVASVNNTAALTLKMTTNAQATVFTQVPSVNGSLRVRGTQQFYWEPKRADKAGRPIQAEPPAAGTTQYWTQGSLVLSSGTNNTQINTALGYPWRNYLFMLVRSSSTRANGEADWPDPLIGLKFEANLLYSQYQKALWNREMAQDYGYVNGGGFDVRNAMTANGASQFGPATTSQMAPVSGPTSATFVGIPSLENGVKVVNFNRDFAFNKPGSETRRTYLVTSPGSNWIFNGSLGNAGTLFSIVNYVAPAGGNKGDTASLTGGQ